MNKLSVSLFLFSLAFSLKGESQSLITEQPHIAKQVGIYPLEGGRTFYTIITSQNHYFVLSDDEIMAQGLEFKIGSAELLTEEPSAWGEIKNSFKSDKLYLIKDIDIISIPSKMNGKCFRSYIKTKKILPCDDKKPAT